MVRLELTEQERTELLHIVRRYEAALNVEIVHTDHRELRKALCERADVAAILLQKVECAVDDPASGPFG